VQHILHDYSTADFTYVDDSWLIDGVTIQKEAYVAALKVKTLDCARDIIRTIRRSNGRREGFKDMIVKGNERGWWKDEDGNPKLLPVVELLLDEATRWDSCFIMLNRFRTLRKVSSPNYTSRHGLIVAQAVDRFLQQSLPAKRLTSMQWHFLEDLEVILEVSVAVLENRDPFTIL
jgi:hypothetical protein